jgi:hypothetical protein
MKLFFMTIKPPLLRTGASVRNYYILKFMRSKNTTLFCKDSDESNGGNENVEEFE